MGDSDKPQTPAEEALLKALGEGQIRPEFLEYLLGDIRKTTREEVSGALVEGTLLNREKVEDIQNPLWEKLPSFENISAADRIIIDQYISTCIRDIEAFAIEKKLIKETRNDYQTIVIKPLEDDSSATPQNTVRLNIAIPSGIRDYAGRESNITIYLVIKNTSPLLALTNKSHAHQHLLGHILRLAGAVLDANEEFPAMAILDDVGEFRNSSITAADISHREYSLSELRGANDGRAKDEYDRYKREIVEYYQTPVASWIRMYRSKYYRDIQQSVEFQAYRNRLLTKN